MGVNDGNGAVGLKDDMPGMFDIRATRGPQCGHELMVGDFLEVHILLEDVIILHEKHWATDQ